MLVPSISSCKISIISSLAYPNVESQHPSRGIRVRSEQEVSSLSNTFTKDLPVSGSSMSHLHAQGLYVPEVFVFFEPSSDVSSSMTTVGNSMSFGAMTRNLCQMNISKKVESTCVTTLYLFTARVIFLAHSSSLL